MLKKLKRNKALRGVYRLLKNSVLYIGFLKDFREFNKISKIKFKDRQPRLGEKSANTPFDGHYIYHPAWAARILAKTKPAYHVDISSTLTFSTIVSAFLPVRFYDFRPANLHLDNLTSERIDLTQLNFETESLASLSCMHTVEHVGLGRYGDPIDPAADLKAVRELQRVVKPGGDLLFVTPVGRSVIKFNAHRIYSYAQVIKMFSDCELQEWSLLPDNQSGGLIRNAPESLANAQKYGCGCFWFKKK